MSNDLSNHYRAVLEDLQGRKAALSEELKQVNLLIDGMSRHVGAISGLPTKIDERKTNTVSYDYGKMSVRWGVLAYLAEEGNSPAKTPQIANALLAGGYKSGGANFPNIVSGVLVGTLKARGEIEGRDDGYRLTLSGVAAWQHIKGGYKFATQQAS